MRNVEDRQFVKLVITLTDVEPGVNFKLSSFAKKDERNEGAYIELNGWELPLSWLTGELN